MSMSDYVGLYLTANSGHAAETIIDYLYCHTYSVALNVLIAGRHVML